MNEPTLREELEGVAADVYALRLHEALCEGPRGAGALRTRLVNIAAQLRTLAARCEPEKPGEAAALPEILRQARRALERCAAGAEDGYKEARAALSAIEAYRPEPQGEVVREVVEHMRRLAEQHSPYAFIATAETVLKWAARLESAAIPAAPDEGACARALRGLVRMHDQAMRAGDFGQAAELEGAWSAARSALSALAPEPAATLAELRGLWWGAWASSDPSEARSYNSEADALQLEIEARLSRTSAHADSGEGAGPRIEVRRATFQRLFKISRAAMAIDDAIAEFGLDNPAILAEAIQALHDALPTPEERLANVLDGLGDYVPAPPAPAPSAAGEGEDACPACGGVRAHGAACAEAQHHVSEEREEALRALVREELAGLLVEALDQLHPTASPPARGNAPRSDEGGGGQGEGRAEGGSGLLAPASAPERCGAHHHPSGARCLRSFGHWGAHLSQRDSW